MARKRPRLTVRKNSSKLAANKKNTPPKPKQPKKAESAPSRCKQGTTNSDKIRVGKEFQAVIPDLIPESERNSEQYLDKALLVWSPTYQISDQKVDEYINLAKDKYGYNGEQALGMLFWHKHDLEQAMNDLANFTPFPEEWSLEDKALFEQAFQFHGKKFHRIRQMLPEKTIPALVKYYYSWKKMKSRTSLMDRQARKLAIIRSNVPEEGTPASDPSSEMGSNTDSESDDKKWIIHRGIRRESSSPPRQAFSYSGDSSKEKDNANTSQKQNSCTNCGVLCNETVPTTKGAMCRTCALHFKRTGNPRPTIGPARGRMDRHFNASRNRRTPPRGMYINHDDLTAIAHGSAAQSDHVLKSLDRELLTLKRIVQNNKQSISALKTKTAQSIDTYKTYAASVNHRIVPQWTNNEMLLAVQSIRNFGKDYQAIADIIGTKTKAHVKTFYVNNRKRYNLDMLLQDHEKEYGSVADRTETKLESIDVDGMSSDSDGTPISNSSSPSSPVSGLNNNNTSKPQAVVAAK